MIRNHKPELSAGWGGGGAGFQSDSGPYTGTPLWHKMIKESSRRFLPSPSREQSR
jgi:hypothetical protein